MNRTSRRALLAGAPAAAAAAAAALAIGGIANTVAIAMSKAPESPNDDPDAELIELARQLLDITPDVDASVDAVRRADAQASRATMVRLGMDADAPGAKLLDKDTEKDECERRMAVWTQVREELGNSRIEEEHDRIQALSDQLFEEMLALPIRTLRGAALVGTCSILTGAISSYWQQPIDELDWPETVIRRFVENLHAGFTRTPLVLRGEGGAA
jgi:hypothetical protein